MWLVPSEACQESRSARRHRLALVPHRRGGGKAPRLMSLRSVMRDTFSDLQTSIAFTSPSEGALGVGGGSGIATCGSLGRLANSDCSWTISR